MEQNFSKVDSTSNESCSSPEQPQTEPTSAPQVGPPPPPPQRKLYFINEIVEWQLTQYIWTGCTQVHLRDQIMSHATELIRQIIRKQGLHTIYPGQEESSFGDLINTAWCQIERTLYKYRSRPHCRWCFNPDRPADSLLYHPADKEYGIKTIPEILGLHRGRRCPHCGKALGLTPMVDAKQGTYGGSTTVLYRGMSKVFNMWCVAPSTMIQTCHGPMAASEVADHFEVGFPVHIDGLDGLALVEAVKFRDKAPSVHIITTGGYDVECSPEHRFYAHNRDGLGWFEASTLSVGDLVAIRCAQDQFGDYRSLAGIRLLKRGAWECPAEITLELAYILGLYIAEGSCSYGKLCIYNVDDEIVAKLVNNRLGLNFIHEPKFGRISLCNVRFIELLDYLGFPPNSTAQTKAIPPLLLCLPRHLMAAMLSGMFDGDGHSTKQSGLVGYTTTSPVLLGQLRMVFLNFGIITKLSRDTRHIREFLTSNLSGAVQLSFSTRDSMTFYDQIGFGLTRKQENRRALRPINDFMYGLNDRFRSLYKKYGAGTSNYNRLRRLLKADKCTVKTAEMALAVWSNYQDDDDHKFATSRLVAHCATVDRLVWVPIKEIRVSESELIDFAVDTPSHSYIANGLVVHNSQVARTVILAYIKKEGRDRKNSGSYMTHLGNKSRPLPGMLVRCLGELRELWKFHDDHLKIIGAIEWLFQHDDRPHDGVIGKLVEQTGLSRATITNFISLTKLRSIELSDSNINRGTDEPKIDRRKGSTEFDDEP
jgi:intein/homing endonuclease